jgi:hypothetical protein
MRINDDAHSDLARFAEREAVRRLEAMARRMIAKRHARGAMR